MNIEKANYSVPPVERAIRVLRYIADGHQCTNTSRAAKELGINRTTLLRLLHTLQQERMIESVGEAEGYVIGTGLIQLAASALYSRDIVQIAQPVLKELAVKLGLSSHLGIIEGRDILYLLRETPNLHLISNVRVGSRLPAHATTIGRIILANSTEAGFAEIFEKENLVAVTKKTATSPEDLRQQLEVDQKIGVAWSVGNFEAGIGSAAAAVFDASGKAVAAINVTGPEREFASKAGRREEIYAAMTEAANHISHQLGFIAPPHQTKLP